MYAHFDGQYRSAPRVSLRGASKQEEKDMLLQRAHREREQREMDRRRLAASVTIQACYRGHREKQRQYALFRAQFDSSAQASVLTLSRLLIMFYSEKKDHNRLISLSQKWLQSRQILASEAIINPTCAFYLSRILVLCSQTLLLTPEQQLAVPLRMLEVFLTPESYTSHLSGGQLVEKVTATLVSNDHLLATGYFKSLRRVLEVRVPPPMDTSSFPSPLAASLLRDLTRPLLCGDGGDWHLTQFTRDLLTDSLSPHVAYLLLPHLTQSNISPASVIQAVYTSLLSGSLPPSRSLLYSLLQLVHKKLSSLSQSTLSQYLHLLAVLLSRSTQDDASSDWVELDNEDFGEWEGLQEMDFDPFESPQELLACCVSKIVDRNLPLRLRKEKLFSPSLLHGLCALVHQLLQVWGGGGRGRVSPASLFQQLSISPALLQPLWACVEDVSIKGFGQPISAIQYLSRGGQLPSDEGTALIERLSTFSTLFTLYLSTLHDAEFYGETTNLFMPFSLPNLVGMVAKLRDVFVSLHMEKFLPPGHAGTRYASSSFSLSPQGVRMKPSLTEYRQLKQCVYHLLCSLRERDSRRPFCPNRHWEMVRLTKIPPDLFLEQTEEDGAPAHVPASVMKSAELLRMAPFVFPFEERVQFFHGLVRHSKRMLRGHLQEFLIGPSLEVTARRNHIYEDAFSELSQGKDLRLPLRVRLVNVQGLNEPGIDGGGLFREFLSELLKTGFDPNHGFFTTTQEGQLYPNPQVHLLSDNFAAHYHFLGSMLGKALYENLLVELPFAGFFLCKLTDRGRGRLEAYHLSSLDPELYRHLLSLKHYEGNVEDLELNFTTISSEFGQSKVVELKPGGADIPVTRENCVQYIHLLANWRLNVTIERQFRAFRDGLASVVPLQWLRLFNQGELQVLISGAEVPIDIKDLRAHTKYAGEYKEDHESIQQFWKVVENFSEEEKQHLLKFVTSCSRPPLLGFKDLFPPFCIMSGGKDDRLPSASTCMNLLKLPIFPDIETLRSRLQYALSSGAGFELS